MNRLLVLVGASMVLLVVQGVGMAGDARPKAQAAADRAARPAPAPWRYDFRYRPYDRGYYSPYGYSYSPYGYIPPGTTPYVLGYNPATGATFLYPYQGGYGSYYPPAYPYPEYGYGYAYPPAVFAPAGQLYGPGPIQQLMGVDHWFRPPQPGGNLPANGNLNRPAGNANGNPAPANPARPEAAPRDPPPAPKRAVAAGGKAMELAWKFVAFGDAHFGNQKYSDALDRYRRASRECPQLGDVWFRQGFALAAQGRYDEAAKAMRRGLEEKPDWPDAHFRLNELYGDDSADKKSRLDGMVKAAEANPTNGDLAFVVGVHLYCDGKADQAEPFLRRTAQIRGTDMDVKAFLAKGQEAGK